MIKVAAPNIALKIIDNAIQAFGAAGVSDDAVWLAITLDAHDAPGGRPGRGP